MLRVAREDMMERVNCGESGTKIFTQLNMCLAFGSQFWVFFVHEDKKKYSVYVSSHHYCSFLWLGQPGTQQHQLL